MKARIFIESASLDPSELKIAYQAFDGAWDVLASRYTGTAAIEGARLRLATLILSLVKDTKDAAEMQEIAVQEMTTGD